MTDPAIKDVIAIKFEHIPVPLRVRQEVVTVDEGKAGLALRIERREKVP